MRISDWSSDVCSSDLGVGDERQSDAGVARRPLDDRAAGAQAAVRFGVADDIERAAVLHRPAGVGLSALATAFAAGGFAPPFQLPPGRIADEVAPLYTLRHALTLATPTRRRTQTP